MEIKAGCSEDVRGSPFSRNKYFSPLAPKFKFKPRISYYAKYLIPHQLKSCNNSPVSIRNYKDLHSSIPSKPSKSCLYLKQIPAFEDNFSSTFDTPRSPKLIILPMIKRPIDINSTKNQVKLKQVYKKTSERKLFSIPNNTHCISELSTFDTKDLKLQIRPLKCESVQRKMPKSLKKVKELLRAQKLVETGDNTDEYSLIGWEMNSSLELQNESLN